MSYEFGDYRLIPDQFELQKGGDPVSVEPQVFLLLKLLIERRDRVVTKEEIVDQIWEGRAVSDASISSRIKSARIAVGDIGKEKHTIRTVHGQGFRFIAEARFVEAKPGQVNESFKLRFQSFKHRVLLGAGTGLMIILLGAYFLFPAQERHEPAVLADMNFPLPEAPSIAVLPFNSFSDEASQNYFADGMTEDLITDLSRLPGLFVIARTSTARYREKPVSIRQVAEDLGVRFVLEGSVRREGDDLRVNAQLIDALTGYHVWAERFDKPVADIFDMQDEIVSHIISGMSVELDKAQISQIGSGSTTSVKAYDLFLQGQAHYRLATPAAYSKAVEYFEQALLHDPEYPKAHAALASIYWFAYDSKWDVHLGVEYLSLELTKHHLAKALNASSVDALLVSAEMLVANGQNVAALKEAEKAIALQPGNAHALDVRSWVFFLLGRAQEAEIDARLALRLDPDNRVPHLRQLGRALFAQQRYDEAAQVLEQTVELQPEHEFAYHWLAAAYGHLKRSSDAERAISKFNELTQETIGSKLTIERMKRVYGGEWYDLDRGVLFRFISGLRKAGVPNVIEAAPEYKQLVKRSNGQFDVEGAIEIDATGAKSLFDRGAVFVDSRGAGPYSRGHIPGAINLPGDAMTQDMLSDHVSPNSEVVFYCGGLDCSLSANATAKAMIWGFARAYYFAGGYPAWKGAGNPVDSQ